MDRHIFVRAARLFFVGFGSLTLSFTMLASTASLGLLV